MNEKLHQEVLDINKCGAVSSTEMLNSPEIKIAIEDSTISKLGVKDAVEKQAVKNGTVNSHFEWNTYLNHHLQHLTEMCDSCNAAMKMS